MKKSTRIVSLLLAMVMLLCLAACGSNDNNESKNDGAAWPKQPVNIVVPAAAGGGMDNIARLINEYFAKKTGQSFVIDNITGVSGYEKTHNANADGYNFIMGTTTIFTSKADGTLTYDWEDYAMVSFLDSPYNTSCIAVQASSPYKTLQDLLAACKADPASVTGGITLTGQPLMIVQALQNALGYELYTTDVGNASERNAALLGGHVDWILNNTSSCDPYVQSGDFRILAVCGEERYPMNPDVPTIKECGVDFSFPSQPMVFLAPKGTPAEVCEAFNKILTEICGSAEFEAAMKEKLKSTSYTTHDVADSAKTAKTYADTLAPYVK